MNVEVRYGPAYALALVNLDARETIQVEGGAMVAMTPSIEMKTEAKGGLLKSLGRSMFGGECFFLNTYTAASPGDSIALTGPGKLTLQSNHNRPGMKYPVYKTAPDKLRLDPIYGRSRLESTPSPIDGASLFNPANSSPGGFEC